MGTQARNLLDVRLRGHDRFHGSGWRRRHDREQSCFITTNIARNDIGNGRCTCDQLHIARCKNTCTAKVMNAIQPTVKARVRARNRPKPLM